MIFDCSISCMRSPEIAVVFAICRTFRLYDDNGNKRLDLEELRTGLRDYGIVLSDCELRELFTALDTDSTGAISFDEFLIALRVNGTCLLLSLVVLFYSTVDAPVRLFLRIAQRPVCDNALKY